MSDDTLTSLLGEAISKHISPLMKGIYGLLAASIVGTAFVVGMWYDVRYSVETARREASEARQAAADLRATVIGHDRDIAVLKFQRGAE